MSDMLILSEDSQGEVAILLQALKRYRGPRQAFFQYYLPECHKTGGSRNTCKQGGPNAFGITQKI